MISTSGCVCTKSLVSFLSASRSPSRVSTASANRASRSAACAMRRQFAHCPQSPADRPSQSASNNSKPAPASAPACTSLPPRAGKNHRMRKPLPRQHIAQAVNSFGVAVKIGEAHFLPLVSEVPEGLWSE